MSNMKVVGPITVELWTIELISLKLPLTLTCGLDLENQGPNCVSY